MSNDSIWVKNPSTGRDIDVAPLFRMLDQFDAPAHSAPNVGPLLAIRRVIRLLNLTVHDPAINTPLEVATCYSELHKLEELFEGLIERQPENETIVEPRP